MTPQEHKEWLRSLSQAEIDWAWEEYVRQNGESERDASVRDLNHVLEMQSGRATG